MPPASDTLPGLLAGLLAADGTRPLVTFYDDTAPAGGAAARIELSVASFENAVAKTANLLQDELGTEPGEPVCLLLPCHWQSAVWVFSVAACGLRLVSDPRTADVVVCGPQTLSTAVSAGARDVVAMALTPFGGAFTEPLPPGVLDHGRDAPGQPDAFAAALPVGPDLPFLGEEPQVSVLRRARSAAERAALPPGGRLMTNLSPADLAGPVNGLVDGLLAAVVQGGSAVLVGTADAALLERRARQEQVTTQLIRS
jgi:uncharacterized protein (TIGR03089 family)